MTSFIQIDFRHLIATMVAIVMLVVTQNSSRAGLIVSIPHVTVAPGGTGFLDVLVSSDSLTGDSFSDYILNFTISGFAQSAEPISFVTSVAPAPQLAATAPDYIFRDDSFVLLNGGTLEVLGDSAGLPVANDLMNVVDFTNSGFDRTIKSVDGNFLLARLNFVAPISATIGNAYDITLEGNSILGSASYSANVGSITISSAAVPEPGTFGALVIVGMVAGWRKCRRRNLASNSVDAHAS